MEALKEDDIDGIVPLFAFSAKPYVTDIVALILRNLTRFVTQDYYIGSIKRVTEIRYQSIIGQKHTVLMLFIQHLWQGKMKMDCLRLHPIFKGRTDTGRQLYI